MGSPVAAASGRRSAGSGPLAAQIFSPATGDFGRTRTMKRFSAAIVVLLAMTCVNLFARGKIDLQTSDTVLGILQKNMGQTVELRMKSGEKIGGKVEKVGDKLVHLSQLTGAEFFDAAVDTAEVAAVVVRTKK